MSRLRYILIALVLSVLVTNCRTPRNIFRANGRIKPLPRQVLLEKLYSNESSFNWAFIKMDGEATMPDGKSTGFNATLKWRKDSAMWVSISPALGIEVLRILLLQDSVMALNKLDKEAYLTGYAPLGKKFQADLSFATLENLLLAHPVLLDSSDKFQVRIEDNLYLLRHIPNRKIRKGLRKEGLDYSDPDSSFIREADNRFIQKGIAKESKDVFIKMYRLDGHFNLRQTVLHDVANDRLITASYDHFREEQGLRFPGKIRIDLASRSGTVSLQLTYSRIRINEVQRMPFKVSSRYDQKSW